MTTITINGENHETDLTQEQIKTALGIKSRVWKPKYFETVYVPTTDRDGKIIQITFSKTWESDYLLGSIFQTEQEAKKEFERLCAIKRVKDFILENFGEFVIDWADGNQEKYEIYFDYANMQFLVNECINYKSALFIPYFKKQEYAQQVIDNCETDLKIIFGIE